MTARRLTALIYLLLIVSVFAHVGINIYAALGHDVAPLRYLFLGSTRTLTHHGVLVSASQTGVHFTWLSLPLTLAALALIFSQRSKHAMYYADHMKWQLNNFLAYLGMMLVAWGMVLLFPYVFVSVFDIMPNLLYVAPALIELWFLYRMARGLWCLGKGQSVYFNGAPMPAENS